MECACSEEAWRQTRTMETWFMLHIMCLSRLIGDVKRVWWHYWNAFTETWRQTRTKETWIAFHVSWGFRCMLYVLLHVMLHASDPRFMFHLMLHVLLHVVLPCSCHVSCPHHVFCSCSMLHRSCLVSKFMFHVSFLMLCCFVSCFMSCFVFHKHVSFMSCRRCQTCNSVDKRWYYWLHSQNYEGRHRPKNHESPCVMRDLSHAWCHASCHAWCHASCFIS